MEQHLPRRDCEHPRVLGRPAHAAGMVDRHPGRPRDRLVRLLSMQDYMPIDYVPDGAITKTELSLN